MDYWTRGRTLGHGSTATVSLATSISGEVFAVKSAELSHSEFFQREQTILSSISSPHIVCYKGFDVTKENSKVLYNLFLEYMPGGTLSDLIQAHGGRLDEAIIGKYTWQIVEALNYLHSNGLVHCDIKGRNVLIGQSGAKIADFGCAKRIDEVEKTAAIGGTPMFMAPEVARGEEQGFASDIWALGCTIIEMATGRAPWFNRNDAVSVLYQIGFSDELPEFPSFLSDEAKDFLEKCLRRNPKERWSANQLVNHPFLVKFKAQKQNEESNLNSYSPTSILEQGFWNSVNDNESENLDNYLIRSSGSERIKRLSLSSGGPNWEWDVNWICVRGNGNELKEDEDDRDTIMDGNELKEEDGSMNEKSNGGSEQLSNELVDRVSGYFLGECKYGKESFVESLSVHLRFHKDKVVLLIPYTSILTLQV